MRRNLHVRPSALSYIMIMVALLHGCVGAPSAGAQQQEPEDPEDEKRFGLWLDQTTSAGLSQRTSLELEFHQRFDEGGTNLFEYFFQGGVGFRPRSWITLIPSYRYQRFPPNPDIDYENRLLFNATAGASRGPLVFILRTLIEGRFPNTRPASARFRFRPGIEYPLPLRSAWRPTVVVNNEFFIVPWENPYANGGTPYTQNRFQAGVRFPLTDVVSVRPYFMMQSVNLPEGWDTNEIIGISLACRVPRKRK